MENDEYMARRNATEALDLARMEFPKRTIDEIAEERGQQLSGLKDVAKPYMNAYMDKPMDWTGYDGIGNTTEAPFAPDPSEAKANPQPFMAAKENTNYPERARALVYDFIKDHLEKTDTHVTFSIDEVYTVWFCKTLQNWKGMFSTTLPDGMYYEVTYNGDKGEAYIDAYKKFDNVKVLDSTLY